MLSVKKASLGRLFRFKKLKVQNKTRTKKKSRTTQTVAAFKLVNQLAQTKVLIQIIPVIDGSGEIKILV